MLGAREDHCLLDGHRYSRRAVEHLGFRRSFQERLAIRYEVKRPYLGSLTAFQGNCCRSGDGLSMDSSVAQNTRDTQKENGENRIRPIAHGLLPDPISTHCMLNALNYARSNCR